jgi:hypothetical protein
LGTEEISNDSHSSVFFFLQHKEEELLSMAMTISTEKQGILSQRHFLEVPKELELRREGLTVRRVFSDHLSLIDGEVPTSFK